MSFLNGIRILGWKISNWLEDYIGSLLISTILIVSVSALFGLATFYAGTTGLITLSILISVMVSYLFGKLKGATPNGNGAGPIKYLIVFAIVTVSVGFYGYGISHLVSFYLTGEFNKPFLYCWTTVIFVLPISMYVFNLLNIYFQKRKRARNFIEVPFAISHFIDLPIYITGLKFLNEKTKKETLVNLNQKFTYRSFQERKQEGIQKTVIISDNVIFDKKISIPADANKFYLSWYSVVEYKYYDGEYSINLNKLNIKKEKNSSLDPKWESQLLNYTDPLHLRIRNGGSVEVFSRGEYRWFYFKQKAIKFPEHDKTKILDLFANHCFKGDHNTMYSVLQEIKESRRNEKLIEVQKRNIDWKIIVENIPGELDVFIQDAMYHHYDAILENINTLGRRILPETITLFRFTDKKSVHYIRTYFYFDVLALYDFALRLVSKKEDTFFIQIIANTSSENRYRVLLRSDDKVLEFTDFETREVSSKPSHQH